MLHFSYIKKAPVMTLQTSDSRAYSTYGLHFMSTLIYLLYLETVKSVEIDIQKGFTPKNTCILNIFQ